MVSELKSDFFRDSPEYAAPTGDTIIAISYRKNDVRRSRSDINEIVMRRLRDNPGIYFLI